MKHRIVKYNRTLDRIVKFDERSRNYPIRTLISKSSKPRSYTWACDLNLDQGPDGACTGFAVAHEAAAKPKKVKDLNYYSAMGIYNRAKQLDEWVGEDYEGSSVLAAMKAAVEKNWYSEYRWAFGEKDLSMAVGHYGPAVLGINWYTGMFDVDSEGTIKPTGKIEGGHAILCNGYSFTKKMYRLHNSWGSQWGIDGYCFIKAEDLSNLLNEQGEACVTVGRLLG
jgi:hypothetical protein